MAKIKDLTGIKVGKLTVIEPTSGRMHKSVIWRCRCECGGYRLVQSSWIQNIAKGRVPPCESLSCGCAIPGHGMCKTATYRSWHSMLHRTRDPSQIYHFGKVTVCPEWDTRQGGSFENFYRDMGERPGGTSINRINGAPLYSKGTCEWADSTLQIYDQKRRTRRTPESGKTGVRKHSDGQWIATISQYGKAKHLYYGPSLEAAIEIREKAELELYGFLRDEKHKRNPA